MESLCNGINSSGDPGEAKCLAAIKESQKHPMPLERMMRLQPIRAAARCRPEIRRLIQRQRRPQVRAVAPVTRMRVRRTRSIRTSAMKTAGGDDDGSSSDDPDPERPAVAAPAALARHPNHNLIELIAGGSYAR